MSCLLFFFKGLIMQNIKASIRQFFLGMSVKDFLEIGLILLGLGFLTATTFGWLPVWQTLLGTLGTLVATVCEFGCPTTKDQWQ
jgi:hypothetical protein